MNRIRHAAPDWALDSMQMAAVFAQLHLGYKHRRSFSGGPRSCLTPISAGILLISIGVMISQAQAQTISLPSTTTTVTLQTLSPGSTTFDAPAGTVINASSGDGVDGNNAQNWVFTNHGSITGAAAGVSLSSATLNGLTLDNFSTIKGNGSAGLALTNGGQLNNHAGATIAGSANGVQISGAGSAVSNDGSITPGSDGYSAVYFDAGGTFTQSATGTLGTNGGAGYGVVFNSGSVAGTNAGTIYGGSANNAFWTRNSSTGAFSNSGTFSANFGAVLASNGVTLTNTGTITGTGGTAVLLSGSGNTLILGTGSVLNGSATSNGANNVLTRQGSGSAGNNLTGFSTLNMVGTAWTLSGANSTTGTTATATNVQSGVLTLTGTLTNGGTGGGTTIASGATLQVGNGGTTGSVTGNIADNGSLVFNRSDALTYAALISGTGSFTQSGAGNLTLSSANTYTGATTIQVGTLTAGIANILANSSAVSVNSGAVFALNNFAQTANNLSGAGTVTLGSATLTANNSTDTTFSGLISGTGALTKTGSSALTLGGTGSSTGTVSVNTGTLTFAQSGLFTATGLSVISGASSQINNGAQLAINGATTIGGNLDVSGRLTTASALLDAGAIVQVDTTGLFSSSATNGLLTNAGTGTVALINNGTVTTTGSGSVIKTVNASVVTNITNAGTIGSNALGAAVSGVWASTGTVNLINRGAIYGGANNTAIYLADANNTITLGAGSSLHGGSGVEAGMAAGVSTNVGAVSNGANNTITLIETGSESADFLGQGNASTQGFAKLTASSGSIWSLGGKINLIGTAADTLKVSGALTVTGQISNSGTGGGATIDSGATLNLGNGGASGTVTGNFVDNGTLSFNRSDSVTFANAISGTGTATQAGTGTTILTGANTYAGGTTIGAGTLQIGNGGTTGSIAGDIADNAALAFNRSDVVTYGGLVSGTGSLAQQGSGTLVLTGNNTFTGGTTINAGTLQLGNGGNTGAVLGDITDNTALVFDRSDATTYGGVVGGAGSFTQQGSGTTALTGANTYTGDTTINAGTLQLTGAGAIGSGQVNLASAGTLLINNPASGNFTFNNALTGSGILQALLGNSTHTFTLGNTVGSAFTGTIAIGGGTFMLDSNAQSAMPATTLRLDTGGLAQINANRAIGNLTFNGGTFQITSTGFIPDGKLTVGNLDVASGGTVALGIPSDFPVHPLPPQPSLFDQDDNILQQLITATGTVTGAGTQLPLTKFDGSPTAAPQNVTLSENGVVVAIASYNYATNVLAGINAGVWLGYDLVQLDLQAGQTLELTNANAVDHTLSAKITGSGNLFIDAVNTAILNNATNDYTGATTLNSGTLVLGSDNALGHTVSLALNEGTVADINGKTQAIGALGGAGTLNIDAGNLTINNGGTFSGVIGGTSGALNANGGTLVLTGENLYTGGTTINAGTLQIGDGGTTGSYAGNITNNAALAFKRSDATSYGGVVSGTGSLTQQGSGALILTANNTYTGGTTISAGTLQLGNGGTVGGIVGDVVNNGVLAFNRSDNLTFDGIVSGTGSLTQAGSGTVLFNGVQTYSGATNVNAGTLAIGDASHTGAELAGNGLVTIGAAGALGGYGKVAGSVINNGVIAVGNALPALANGPDASFTIAGNLDNHGTVTMSNGVAGDRMTTGGTYTSNGGKVLIDTVLNQGGPASNSDVLVVGATAVGSKGATQLVVTNVGGAGATTVDNGIMVVQVLDPAHSATGAFSLSGRAVAGPYEYQLFQGGQQTTDGNWYLRTELEPTPPTPPNPPTPPAPPQPLFRPEVAAYLANQHVAQEMFVHSLDDRSGVTSQTSGTGSGGPGSVWLRVEGRTEGSNSSDGTFSVNTDAFLMQGGGDVAQKKLTSGADLLHLGLMGTYETARSNVEAASNSAGASGNVAGYSVGAYGTWYQNEESRLGAYADTSLQYGWFNDSVDGDQLPTVNYNAHGWAVSGEVGYALPLINEWVIEPQGQLLYVDYHQNSLTESNGTQVDGASSSGAITRLGLRLQRTFQRSAGQKMQFYAVANWWHSSTDSSISFDQVSVGSLYPANRYEAKLGLNGDLGKNWSAWSNVSGAWGAQSYHAYVVRLGLKYAW